MLREQSVAIASKSSLALTAEVFDEILSGGAVAVGVTSVLGFESEMNFLLRRKVTRRNDSMQFTYRNPYRSTHITASYPYAKSIVVAALAYPKPSVDETNHIASYARKDYYGELRSILEASASHLRELRYRSQVVLDDNALVDKAAARRAGLGWIGKNSLLLVPKVGSNVVLGSIVTSAELKVSATPVSSRCGSCHRCQQACPTGALDEAGVLEVSKCISWLLQREGPFPLELRESVGQRIYGCDECQVVCPIGSKTVDSACDALRPMDVKAAISPVTILSLGDDELLQTYGRLYIPRRAPNHLRRNALLALGNKDMLNVEEFELLSRYRSSDDPILVEQATWSLSKHGFKTPYTSSSLAAPTRLV